MQIPVINRNGIDMTFVMDMFGKRSTKNAGTEFPIPVLKVPLVREIELDGKTQKVLVDIEPLLWVGVDDAFEALNNSLRRSFAEIYLDNVDEKTGVFAEDQWKLDAAEFTAAVEKLGIIEDKLDSLAVEQIKVVDDPNFGEGNEQDTALQERIKAINTQVKTLRVKRAGIQAKYQVRAEKRAARKAAEAKAAGTTEGAKAPEAVAA